MKFRKKPVVIDAFRWDGNNPMELQLWFDDHGVIAGPGTYGLDGASVFIKTLEGTMLASPGDWIIRGVKGEFYPCKPNIFEATYTSEAAVYCECPMCEHHTSARVVTP